MRYIFSIFIVALMLIVMSGSVSAAPNSNNPQVVADYSSGTHGIVGEDATHTGSDVVMQAGNSGNFQQWFNGSTTETGVTSEGDHSVWQSVGDATTCASGWDLVENANLSWGSYLQPGNYCVHTNGSNVH